MTGPLQALLAPAAVAVVGASDNIHKVGGRPLQYLAQQGFRGRVYPVNPRAATVQGLRAYPSLEALPEVPDAVVVCIASEGVEEQLVACGRLGVKAVVLFASGYAETGSAGRERQQHLQRICQRAGVRLLGPNSIGVASFDSGAVLSFASIYADCAPQDGPVAIVSQSGAFGVSLYALLRERGVGVRCVAATGNEADLDTADFIAALAQRPGVHLVLLYLENVRDPERMRAALVLARECGVQVVAVRAGASEHGRRSAGLHTGAQGAGMPALDALFDGAGCRSVADLDALLRCVPGYLQRAQAAMRVRLPAKPRLAVVSNSGAYCVLAADQASRVGLPLARLSDASCARMGALLPAFSLNRNPLDLTAALLGQPGLLGDVVACALADPAVDTVVLGLLAMGGPSYDIARFARDCRAAVEAEGKSLWLFSPHAHVRSGFAQQGFPVFRGEAEAVAEIAGFALHLAGRATPLPADAVRA
ncbi:CoA-binding protein [Pseudorhodoferax soli]|uniref:Acyl-CoA synthetase (NDP forming) n=1 Tax=Pseudorhodoferax soli TaxID=545864 RepID=A0A368XDK3_9BURK|nr:CoA-binding protein [Pseudorhodoferax soli]RCW64114.1 acyl-CoA synthetase (NDP forming) [Pseudorhodoferax soli]